MNMFARFDENPTMTLQDIKETKCYGRTDRQRENSIPTTNKVCGGYNEVISNALKFVFVFIIAQTARMIWRNGWKPHLID